MSAAPSPAAEAQPTPRNAQNQTQQKMGSRVSLQFLNRCFTYGRTFSARFWRTLPSYLPFYLLVIVVGHAGWKAQTPVTVITPFQQPKGNLPFSGEIVADALQDALTSVQNFVETGKHDANLRSSDLDHLPDLRNIGLADLRNNLTPQFLHVQGTPQFKAEVNGLSYEGIISIARMVVGTDTTISGDVIVNGTNFVLVARTGNAGPWESSSSPLTAEGLKRASRDLAEKILMTQNPTFAGVALLEDGRVDQGLAQFERVRSLNPNDVGAKLNLCMGYGANRRYEEAIECYKEVLKMKPSSPQVILERLAQAYYLNGERDKARSFYSDLAHGPGHPRALLELAQLLEDMDDHGAALNAYEEFLRNQSQAGKDRNHNLAIVHVNKGAAFGRQQKHDEALAEYRKALQYSPGDILILTNIGVELARAGDLDSGILQLQSVVDENANADSASFVFLQLGELLQQKGDWQHATERFRRATERQPGYVEAHLRLGYALVHDGRQTEALSEYSRVAKLSGRGLDRTYSQVFAQQWLGNALRDQKKYAAAASVYRKLILLEPDYGLSRCELGFALEKLGHRNQALDQYRAALAVTSKVFDSKEWVVLAHQRLGEALLSQGRAHRTEAIAELRTAIELDGKRLEPYLSLGKALYDEGDFVEAASQYREAIKINPQSAAAHTGLAQALAKQGLVEQAALEYNNAANVDATNGAYSAKLRSPTAPAAPN